MPGNREDAEPLHAPPLSFPFVQPEAPERLVGIGFRCWLAGYRTGDIACWEAAWDTYCRALGPRKARLAVTGLSCWTRSIRRAMQREIKVYPAECRGFCQDECLAIGMVAAGQHGACPVLRACAVTLLANTDVDDVMGEAVSFGESLKLAGQLLSWGPAVEAERLGACAGGFGVAELS